MHTPTASKLAVAVALSALLLLAASAPAGNQTWSGGSTVNGNWSNGANWAGGAAPGSTSGGVLTGGVGGTDNQDFATFNTPIANGWGNSGTAVVIDSANQNVGGINFDTAAGNYTIGSTSGNPLLLAGSPNGEIQILSTLTATNAVETISAPMKLYSGGGAYFFNNFSGAGVGRFVVNGSISGGDSNAVSVGLDSFNNNGDTVSGVISNGMSPALAVFMGSNPRATWSFTGSTSNTYTGLTTVSGGTLLLAKSGSANAIGNGGLTISGSGIVQYGGSSTDMMGTGTVTSTGGTLDFNGATDTIGDITTTLTAGNHGQGSTPLINTAGGGNLTIGSLSIRPLNGSTISVFNAGIGGTLTLGGAVTFTTNGANPKTGQAQITGTTLALGGNRTFTIALGTGSGYDLQISSAITGSTDTLTKSGPGRLQLTGANTYSGNTTVSAGTLALAGSGSIANSPVIQVGTAAGPILDVTGLTGGANYGGSPGAFALAAGQTLQGYGTVNGAVIAPPGTTISPGGSIGTLSVTGAVTIGGTYLEEINGAAADRLAITGPLVLDASTSVLDLPLTNVYDGTTTYTLLSFTGGLTGTFASETNPIPAGYELDYGSSAITLAPTAVREPGTLALVGAAFAGIWPRRRRGR